MGRRHGRTSSAWTEARRAAGRLGRDVKRMAVNLLDLPTENLQVTEQATIVATLPPQSGEHHPDAPLSLSRPQPLVSFFDRDAKAPDAVPGLHHEGLGRRRREGQGSGSLPRGAVAQRRCGCGAPHAIGGT